MTITYEHKAGDVVTVKPYNIFTDPTPIKWTSDAHGYGYEYRPNDTFIYYVPVNIYGQYNPVFINYFILDEHNLVRHIKYENRVGTRIEIAGSFYEDDLDGFVCWNTLDKNILSAGLFITLQYDISAYISCEHHFLLSYDASGGIGYIEPQHGVMHQWVEPIGGTAIYKYSFDTIELKQNSFTWTSDNKIFSHWTINDTIYYPNDTIDLSANLTAYANWELAYKYQLNAHDIYVNELQTFRYLMLNIISTRNNSSIALSKVLFLNADDEAFVVPANTTVKLGNRLALKLITSDDTFTLANVTFPYTIVYDFGIQCLDTSIFKKWQWHTASNSTTNAMANVKHIQLLFSNDGIHWFLADNVNDETNCFPTTNNVIAYSNNDYSVDLYEYNVNDLEIIYKTGCVTNVYGNIYTANKICSASPGKYYEFKKWIGDSFLNSYLLNDVTNTLNPITLTLADYSSHIIVHDISACFTPKTLYTLSVTINDSNMGVIKGYGSSYSTNVFNITAIATDGYSFKEWIGDIMPVDMRNKPNITLTLPKQNPFQLIGAIFEQDGIYTTFYYIDNTIERKKIVGEFTFKHINNRLSEHSTNNTIKKIELGLLVTKIASYACANCTALQEITFAHNDCRIEIDEYAFYNATSLLAIDYSKITNAYVPKYAFYNTSLRDISYFTSGNMSYIGTYAFANCSHITNLTIRNTSIRDFAFYNCNNLTCVTLNNVTLIGNSAFIKCDALTSIDMTSYKNELPSIENPFNDVNSRVSRRITLYSKTESKYAYFNAAWQKYYPDIIPLLDVSDILTMSDITTKIEIYLSPNSCAGWHYLRIPYRIASLSNLPMIIDWGDGSPVEQKTHNELGTYLLEHKYPTSGYYPDSYPSDFNGYWTITITSLDIDAIGFNYQLTGHIYVSKLYFLSKTIKHLFKNAFAKFTGTEITIPAHIESVDENILQAARNLTTLTIENGRYGLGNDRYLNTVFIIINNNEPVKLMSKASAKNLQYLPNL